MTLEYTAVVDSSVLLGYKDGHEGCQDILYKAIDRDIEIIISPLTISKIWSSPDFDRKSEIGYLGLLEFISIYSCDTNIAINTGHYLREYSNDIKLDLEMASIASICDISGYPLVTINPELYQGILERAINCDEALKQLN